jgi:hypothetical protein
MVSIASSNQANFSKPSSIASGPDSAILANQANQSLINTRTKAEQLSSKSKALNSNTAVEEVRSKPVFVNIMDFVKKNTARAMWGLGLGTSGLGVLSYFLVGSKILSLFFAVPALMAFFIGHSLGKNLIKGKTTLFRNPLEQMEAYITNPQKLDSENVQALQTVDELKDLATSDPAKKDEINSQLKRFKEIIEAKYEQVQFATEGVGLRIKQDTERLLDALEIAVNSNDDQPQTIDQEKS